MIHYVLTKILLTHLDFKQSVMNDALKEYTRIHVGRAFLEFAIAYRYQLLQATFWKTTSP